MRRSEEIRLIDAIFPDKLRALIVILILVVCFILSRAAVHWRYHSYSLDLSDSNENTLVYTYYSVENNVLKCASDTALLCNERNEQLWKVNFEMTNPVVETCGEMLVIYDRNGTSIGVYDSRGRLGSFNTDMPIISASVSEQGTVATVLDDGKNTRIDYCDRSGDVISAIKTGIVSEGYPMSISLSPNGQVLAVSFLGFKNGKEAAIVNFYNFGDAGRKENDHIVSSYTYEECIVPEIRYLDDSSCVAFGSDRIIVYDRKDIPLQKETIPVNDVKSVFHTENYFGTISSAESGGRSSVIRIFEKKGGTVLEKEIGFEYIDVAMKESELVLSGRNEMCVISLLGDIKYQGSPSNMMRSVVPIRNNRFAYITAESFNIITLA